MRSGQSEGRLAVLLATFNGAGYLDAQLQSIADQGWAGIDVFVADDGSTDLTCEILRDWANRWTKGKFVILRGPGQGATENFRFLLTIPEVDVDFIAFCDQDDIWLPEKTSASVSELVARKDAPALFGSRTIIVNEHNRETALSPLFTRPPHFRNALVQSICGGNTMVMNWPAFLLLRMRLSPPSTPMRG